MRQPCSPPRSAGLDVARVRSGAPSLHGAIVERIRLRRRAGIGSEITLGVPAQAAAAAALGQEPTIPKVAQTVGLRCTAMRSTSMQPGETLDAFACKGAMLASHPGNRALREMGRALTPYHDADRPAVVTCRVGRPDGAMRRGALPDVHATVRAAGITWKALVLVRPAPPPRREKADAPTEVMHRSRFSGMMDPRLRGEPPPESLGRHR